MSSSRSQISFSTSRCSTAAMRAVSSGSMMSSASESSANRRSSPFEGIRCYKGKQGSAIFRLNEHVDRLFASAHIGLLQIPYGKKEIADAIRETVRVNRLDECYIRPIVFVGAGDMGLYVPENPIRVAIAA